MPHGGGWGHDELRGTAAHVASSRGGASAGGAHRVLPQAGGGATWVGDAPAGGGVREMRQREVEKNEIGAIQRKSVVVTLMTVKTVKTGKDNKSAKKRML